MTNQKGQKVSTKDACYSYMLSLEQMVPDANSQLVMPPKSMACATIPKCQNFLNDIDPAIKEFNIMTRWVYGGSDFKEKAQDKNYTRMATDFLKTECKKEFKTKKDAEQCMIHLKGLSSSVPEKRQEFIGTALSKLETLHGRSKECLVALGKPKT